ncbi:hypothetical protein [Kitasatospora sp. NPDC057223]|uniref:hypothetical protein n=1 Tax=Kitasatospora sp. NPDC057223 TaxID=3346055 RepID=UPI00362F194B
MSKKRSRTVTFGEVVAELPPVEEPWTGRGYRHPVTEGAFVDADGRKWTLVRSRLDPRRAKRLAATADRMSTGGDTYDEDQDEWFPVYVPQADRQAAWLEVKPRLGAHYTPGQDVSYEAYEFTSVDGLTLVYFDVHC